MNEPTTLGSYLRRERERRGLTLRAISESTKVSVALLKGLEADDVSRWPGGIFRRAFVRSYAQCVGLDADDVVRRFEQQHPAADADSPVPAAVAAAQGRNLTVVPEKRTPAWTAAATDYRARLLGTAADLTVAVILALGSAAAGSRLLWPVLLIAAYYAIGILLTGTSPMVALLGEQSAAKPSRAAARSEALEDATAHPLAPRLSERRPRRTNERPRQRRGVHAHS